MSTSTLISIGFLAVVVRHVGYSTPQPNHLLAKNTHHVDSNTAPSSPPEKIMAEPPQPPQLPPAPVSFLNCPPPCSPTCHCLHAVPQPSIQNTKGTVGCAMPRLHVSRKR
mmetsp:Transcript_2930/g.8223  ORF Transcript_2930/g.8223 Transcript_2930/m.8223 type:complete len:110 (-) Transcript_2930:1504-1833(-)